MMNAQTAFISGNDTICDNGDEATIKVDFTGVAPFTFIYSLPKEIQNDLIQLNITNYKGYL